MREDNTTTIRINSEAHEVLRFLAYKENKKIIDIIDDILKDKEKPSISQRVERMLNKK